MIATNATTKASAKDARINTAMTMAAMAATPGTQQSAGQIHG